MVSRKVLNTGPDTERASINISSFGSFHHVFKEVLDPKGLKITADVTAVPLQGRELKSSCPRKNNERKGQSKRCEGERNESHPGGGSDT